MAPAAPQQSQGDNSLAPLWLSIGAFALLGAIWYFASEQITWFILKVKFFELLFISLFTTNTQPLLQTIQTAPLSIPFNDLITITTNTGHYLAYPIAAILVILALVLYVGNPISRFKKTYTMKRLFESEKENYPQIVPVSNVDLVAEHIDKGPWSMAMTPMQFAKRYHLLQEIHTPGGKGGKPIITATILRAESYQTFALQLGPLWPGFDKLNIYTKALFAAFAARANRDSDAATALLRHIASTSGSGKLDFTGTQELLDKHKSSKVVQRTIERHAYTLTVMASLIVAAREDGVLASSDFLWLKVVDRRMWFMLNAIGRQTPHTEASGPFAHWLAEKELGRKISTPMVEEAVNALDGAIKEVIYVPEEKA
jgi:intracellular multiplication protein IcmP